MKVALVHNLRPGGAHRRVAAQLAAIGPDVAEFTLSTALPFTAGASVITVAQAADARNPAWRPILRHTDLLALVAAYSRLGRAVAHSRMDVVWSNPCQFLQSPLLDGIGDAPIVYYCDEPRRADHDPVARARINPRTRTLYGPLRAARRFLDQRAVSRVTGLATNSAFTAGAIERAYGRAATVVPCGVSAVFAPASEPEVPRHLLAVGTLLPSKGHDLVIGAAAASDCGFPVVIVSPRADAAERARLQALADDIGVVVDFRSAISDADLRDLYRGAFATLYLAAGEPLGLASLEAQACGSPVVVAAEGGLPETLDDGVTGWAVPREVGAAARALRCLGEPAVRAAMVDACRARGPRSSWEASTEQLLAVFASVLA